MAKLHLESPGAFFEPLQEGDETPAFLRWAIEFRCGPREQYDGADLEGVFRQLRPLAAVGEAEELGAICDGIAEAEGDAKCRFAVRDVLAYYGAESMEKLSCWDCPANGAAGAIPRCIGLFSLDEERETFFTALEEAAKERGPVPDFVPRTSPLWYGLWADSPLRGERLAWTADLVDLAMRRLGQANRAMRELSRGLRIASEIGAAFHARVTPPGIVRGRRWEIPGHCGFCGAMRGPRQRICKVCGRDDRWESPEKRHLMGIRPYRRGE